MQLTMQEIVREGLAGQLRGADWLAELIYRLYRAPVASGWRGRRVVILQRHRRRTQTAGALLGAAELAQLLESWLLVDHRRAGDVVFDVDPLPSDYVIQREGASFRVFPPERERPTVAEEEPYLPHRAGRFSVHAGYALEQGR